MIADALGELFRTDGAGALRVLRESRSTTARARTYDSAAKTAPRPYTEAVETAAAVTAGRPAALAGLGYDPARGGQARTNLGLLNVGSVTAEVEVAVSDKDGARLGSARVRLVAGEFRQVNDLFAAVGVRRAATGSARVATATPGGEILAYASVVRRNPPAVTYVQPVADRPRPAAAAGGAALPAATPAVPPASPAPPAGARAPGSPG